MSLKCMVYAMTSYYNKQYGIDSEIKQYSAALQCEIEGYGMYRLPFRSPKQRFKERNCYHIWSDDGPYVCQYFPLNTIASLIFHWILLKLGR